MRFFNKRFLHEYHVQMIKEERKNKKIKNKIINYNNNFVDHVQFEKSVRVSNSGDEILQLVEEYLVPWLDPWYIIQRSIAAGKIVEYDFDNLPRQLKKYMRQMDEYFYAIWFDRINYNWLREDLDKRLERLKMVKPDYTNEEFEKYICLGHDIPTTLGKKAKDSARRAYNQVNAIIKANINDFTNFMTLTFADEDMKEKHKLLNKQRKKHEYSLEFEYADGKDFEVTKKCFTEFVKNLKRKYNIKLEYIAVWELQKNGNYHFHVLCTELPKKIVYKVPEWLDYDFVKNERNNAYGMIDWLYGKSDVQEVKDPARLATYVSKYILKSFMNVQPETYDQYLGKKKYFASKGLKRPIEKYVTENEVEEEIREIDVKPYLKVYKNPYNDGIIRKRIYTLIKGKEEIKNHSSESPNDTLCKGIL